jgi:hypothetical protein
MKQQKLGKISIDRRGTVQPLDLLKFFQLPGADSRSVDSARSSQIRTLLFLSFFFIAPGTKRSHSCVLAAGAEELRSLPI